MNPAVIVMVRWWAEGAVKTRLAATIGQDAARIVYRDVAERVWRGLDSPALDRHLWVEPADAVGRAGAWLTGAASIDGQPDGDLGTRLTAAMDAAFSRRAPWAAVVGTDAPAIDAAAVTRAGDRLADADVVLVPSLDGGYALLASARPIRELFVDVPWSSPEVLEVTCGRAKALGLEVAVLPAVRDLDDETDLLALRAAGLL